jgi:predicted O-methyltransferase YrrM
MSILWNLRFIGRRPEYDEVRKFVLGRMPRGGIAAEIGVKLGHFSAKILQIAEPVRLYLIDPWLPDPSGARIPPPDQRYRKVKERFAAELETGRVVVIRERSETAAAKFEDELFDWIYIDGNHHYEFVKRDLEMYYPKVKRGGFIICDDYHYPGTWNDGVTLAVDEFMTKKLARKLFKRRSQFVMRKTG